MKVSFCIQLYIVLSTFTLVDHNALWFQDGLVSDEKV